jgi:hypothetical protein
MGVTLASSALEPWTREILPKKSAFEYRRIFIYCETAQKLVYLDVGIGSRSESHLGVSSTTQVEM